MHDAQEVSAKIIAPPPVLYIGALVIGFLLHAVFPQLIWLSDSVLPVLGVALLLMSAAFTRIGAGADLSHADESPACKGGAHQQKRYPKHGQDRIR